MAGLKPSEAFHSGACWEILGCDIMFDSALRPWLIEVNHSPSLTCDASLDRRIKARLVRETLSMANVKASDRRRAVASARSKAQSRLLHGTRGGCRGGLALLLGGPRYTRQSPPVCHECPLWIWIAPLQQPGLPA